MSDVGADARTVVVTVPQPLVDGVGALLQLYMQELPALDKVIREEMTKAKQLGALVAVRELRALQERAANMYAPVHRATLALGKGMDDVGAFTPRKHTLFGHTWQDGPLDMLPMPAAGFIIGAGERVAAGLVARLGIRRAAVAVTETAIAAKVAGRGFTELLKRLVTRGVLPALGIAGLTAAFESCGKLIGIGIGVGALVGVAGSKAGKKLLSDALPWIAVAFGGLYLLKKGR